MRIVPGNNAFKGVLSRRVDGFSLTGPSKKVKKYTASSLLFFFAKLLHAKPKTSWFAIALDEIRTGRILRQKADYKQSSEKTVKGSIEDAFPPGSVKTD